METNPKTRIPVESEVDREKCLGIHPRKRGKVIGTAFASVTLEILHLNSCRLDGAKSPAAGNRSLTVSSLPTNSLKVFSCLNVDSQ